MTGRSEEQVAIVVNPTKIGREREVREFVAAQLERRGLRPAVWFETTRSDPGAGPANQALDAGATLVCALGGDGTLREVASALVGTDASLGVLSRGTGNLFARHLGLPRRLAAALSTALDGASVAVDVGGMTCDDEPERIFLIMCGLGLDGHVMAGVSERLKSVVGWPAYVLPGVRALRRPPFLATITTGDKSTEHPARAVVVGNTGTLTGGIRLMPTASITDGLLDTVIVDPYGPGQWTAVVADVLIGRDHDRTRLHRRRSAEVEIVTDTPTQTQLDGDAIGLRQHLRCRVHPHALQVRLPRRPAASVPTQP